MTKQAGSARIAHGESTSPRSDDHEQVRGGVDGSRGTTAQIVSPTVTSFGLTGVARIDSYTFDSRSFQKTFVAS